ncbi:hypothetical protein [Agromyces sp. NPDC058064]|uniref:hypothetical protein n=1 Tax=Agromyces sp. NPDC058064 TaxID=3346322 RepID=UPI0036DC8759
MATYTMAPYALWLHPRYQRGGERRPIGDVDGSGGTLREVIDGALARLEGPSLVPLDGDDDDSRTLRVRTLYPYANFTLVEFGVGRSGIAGTLHQRNGNQVPFEADESNETVVRSMFVYPPDGHEAYWLNERASLATAFSTLQGHLVNAIRSRFGDLTVKLGPVAEWSAVTAWANQVQVQELRFDAPKRPGASTQAIEVNGVHADVRIVVKPRGSLTLNRLIGNDGPDRATVFGFLSNAPLVEDSGVTGGQAMNNGWTATVAFKTRGGRQRSFGVAVDDSAPTLIYPFGANAGATSAYRPTDREFAEACAEFLQDAQQRLPINASVGAEILSTLT